MVGFKFMDIKNLGRIIAAGSLAYFLSGSSILSKPLEISFKDSSSVPKYLIESSMDNYAKSHLGGRMIQYGIANFISKIAANISQNNHWFSLDSENVPGEYAGYRLNTADYSLLVAVDKKHNVGAVIYRGISDDRQDIASVADTGILGFGLRQGIDSFKLINNGITNDVLAVNEIIANRKWYNILKTVCDSITNRSPAEVYMEDSVKKNSGVLFSR